MIETITEQMVKRNKIKQLVILATDKSCIRRNLERRSEARLYIVATLFSSTHTIHFLFILITFNLIGIFFHESPEVSQVQEGSHLDSGVIRRRTEGSSYSRQYACRRTTAGVGMLFYQ